jgi:hypothetical protein
MSMGNKNLNDCQFLDINYNGYAFLGKKHLAAGIFKYDRQFGG